MLRKPRVAKEKLSGLLYTGRIDLVEGSLPGFVLLSKVVLKNGKIQEKDWKKLREKGVKHHVVGVTYNN